MGYLYDGKKLFQEKLPFLCQYFLAEEPLLE